MVGKIILALLSLKIVLEGIVVSSVWFVREGVAERKEHLKPCPGCHGRILRGQQLVLLNIDSDLWWAHRKCYLRVKYPQKNTTLGDFE